MRNFTNLESSNRASALEYDPTITHAILQALKRTLSYFMISHRLLLVEHVSYHAEMSMLLGLCKKKMKEKACDIIVDS